MKTVSSIVTFLCIGIIIPNLSKSQTAPVIQPTAQSQVIISKPKPDLTNISIKDRENITNAKVRSIGPNGIVFLCDQGLIQAKFDELPPAFEYYRKSKENIDEAAASADRAKTIKRGDIEVSQKPKIVITSNSHEQDIDSPVDKAHKRRKIKDSITNCEKTIYDYDHQSSFDHGEKLVGQNFSYGRSTLKKQRFVSDAEYEEAKTILEVKKEELAKLGE